MSCLGKYIAYVSLFNPVGMLLKKTVYHVLSENILIIKGGLKSEFEECIAVDDNMKGFEFY